MTQPKTPDPCLTNSLTSLTATHPSHIHANRPTVRPDMENMDNFENFIRHADFGKVLQLADRLKKYEINREEGSQSDHCGDKVPNSFESTAVLVRSTLIPSRSSDVAILGRGECRITDSLIDETLNSLANELKLCHSEFDNAKKFSKWQTDILTDWMIEHRENPYPTNDEICDLAKETNLSNTQVVNWTTNVRKRNLKATVELGKKPHHFLDYLFLATDRETQMRKASGRDLVQSAPHLNHHYAHSQQNRNHGQNGRADEFVPSVSFESDDEPLPFIDNGDDSLLGMDFSV